MSSRPRRSFSEEQVSTLGFLHNQAQEKFSYISFGRTDLEKFMQENPKMWESGSEYILDQFKDCLLASGEQRSNGIIERNPKVVERNSATFFLCPNRT